MTYYAGIGSRRTPDDALNVMFTAAARLAHLGYTLRSGGASGADTAFEHGADRAAGAKQVFTTHHVEQHRAALATVDRYHPAPDRLSNYARLLMARNAMQILGPNTDGPHSQFVMCWTPGASGSGGTGQALRIAADYDIPVFDLADSTARDRIEHWLFAT